MKKNELVKNAAQALFGAFHLRQDLTRLVRFANVGVALSDITSASSMQETCEELVEWAIKNSKLDAILNATLNCTSGSTKAQVNAVQQQYHSWLELEAQKKKAVAKKKEVQKKAVEALTRNYHTRNDLTNLIYLSKVGLRLNEITETVDLRLAVQDVVAWALRHNKLKWILEEVAKYGEYKRLAEEALEALDELQLLEEE